MTNYENLLKRARCEKVASGYSDLAIQIDSKRLLLEPQVVVEVAR